MSAPTVSASAMSARAPSPFGAVLATQWRWSRLLALAGAVAGFALPLLSVESAGDPGLGFPDPRLLLDTMRIVGFLYPVLATLVGLLLAVAPWSADEGVRHVYALSLPVPRSQYVLLRFAAGATIALVPAVAVWLGARIATAVVTLPLGLHARPEAIALRFALATLLAFAIFFGLAASSRRVGFGLLAAAVVVVLLDSVLANSGVTERSLIVAAVRALIERPGPFEIFTGRWMFIDV